MSHSPTMAAFIDVRQGNPDAASKLEEPSSHICWHSMPNGPLPTLHRTSDIRAGGFQNAWPAQTRATDSPAASSNRQPDVDRNAGRNPGTGSAVRRRRRHLHRPGQVSPPVRRGSARNADGRHGGHPAPRGRGRPGGALRRRAVVALRAELVPVGEKDLNIPVGAHRIMAERTEARRTVEIAGASHVVGMSHLRTRCSSSSRPPTATRPWPADRGGWPVVTASLVAAHRVRG